MIGRTNSSMGGGKIKSLNKSCVIWLPLNGNYTNYGTSDLIFKPHRWHCSFVDEGKIYPGCLQNNSHTACGISSDKTIYLGNNQSFFCWVRFSGLLSESELGGAMGGQHRYPSNSGMGLNFKYIDYNNGYLTVSTGNGSSRTYNTYCGKTLLKSGVWYHCGYTYDGTTVKLYVNGVLDGSFNIGALYNPTDYVQIGTWSFESGNTTHTNYHLYGYLQDVRIYDKALTDKEVMTIYQYIPNGNRTKKVRYLRFGCGTNSINTGVHFNEVEIYDENNLNVALGKTPTVVSGGWYNLGYITDGNRNHSTYADAATYGEFQIDLGSVKNISHIIEFHYWGDTRLYYRVTVGISEDGSSWETLYNGDLAGSYYYETSLGHMVPTVQNPL